MRIKKCHALLLAAAVIFPDMLRAQAWLPERGNLSTALLYSDIFDTKHYLPDGEELDVGHTRSYSYGFTVSYSPTDRIMLSAGLPYVKAEYHGERPHPTEVDNSHYHGTLTDLRVEAHYQAALEPVAFAPYIAVVVPTHEYETLGHAAPGRGLTEEWIGFFVGENLDWWIPRTYVQFRYNYAFVQKVAGLSHDRSNADLEVAWFATPQVALRALLYWQHTHGGIEVPVPPSHPLFLVHDQIASERYVNAGAGGSFAFSERMSLYALFTTALSGKNGHKLGRGVNIGLGYSILPR